jgi:hypothetical protein
MYVEISGHAAMRLYQRYGIEGEKQVEWVNDIMQYGIWSNWKKNKYGNKTCKIRCGTSSIILSRMVNGGTKIYRVVTAFPPPPLSNVYPDKITALNGIQTPNNTIVGGNVNA